MCSCLTLRPSVSVKSACVSSPGTPRREVEREGGREKERERERERERESARESPGDVPGRRAWFPAAEVVVGGPPLVSSWGFLARGTPGRRSLTPGGSGQLDGALVPEEFFRLPYKDVRRLPEEIHLHSDL